MRCETPVFTLGHRPKRLALSLEKLRSLEDDFKAPQFERRLTETELGDKYGVKRLTISRYKKRWKSVIKPAMLAAERALKAETPGADITEGT